MLWVNYLWYVCYKLSHRMDKTAYVQTYTMRPLVIRLMNFIQLNKIPSGNMVIVAIMSYWL